MFKMSKQPMLNLHGKYKEMKNNSIRCARKQTRATGKSAL